MSNAYDLYNWQILLGSNDSIYVSGYLYWGNGWETSAVQSIIKKGSYFEVITKNSVYHLH